MKICILICGQIRGLKALQHLAQNITKIDSRFEVSVVISTWSKTGMKFSGALGFGQVARIFNEDILSLIPNNFYGDNFWENFNIASEPSRSEDVTFELLRKVFENCNLNVLNIDIEADILDLEFEEELEDKNSKKMLYKRWRANEIKKRAEKKENSRFDLVLCTRPDLFLNFESEVFSLLHSQIPAKLSQNYIYLPQNEKVERYVNDIFAFGASQVIDIYTSLFSKAISGRWSYIHRAYFDWLKENSIMSFESDAVIAKGFESFKLSYEDVKNRNNFIDYAYNVYSNAEGLTSLPKELSVDEECVLSFIHYQKALEDKNFENAIRYLLKSDFSLRELGNDRGIFNGRDGWLLSKLIELFIVLDISDAEAAFDYAIRSDLLNSNIERVKCNSLFLKCIYSNKVIKLARTKQVNFLQNEVSEKIEYLEPRVADSLISLAVEYESENPKLSLQLAQQAIKIKPNGKFIKFKLNNYEKAHC